jgi:isocitrate dehydrogenase
VQQFVEEGHLRWDSLGEFLALAVSLEQVADKTGSQKVKVLTDALTQATSSYLLSNKSPSRKVNELDNRGSHFYLALYWAQALASQSEDEELQSQFSQVAEQLADNETVIVDELNAVQGSPVDLGGYYDPDEAKVAAAMRPSETLNRIVDNA